MSNLPSREPEADPERVLPRRAAESQNVVPILRDESWPHAPRVLHRRLIPSASPTGPFVTFASDEGDSLVYLNPRATNGTSLVDLEWTALANLSRSNVRVESISHDLVSVSGEFGSEALLLPQVMLRVEGMLRAPLLAVAVPKQGGFLAASAGNVRAMAVLIAWARRSYDDAEGRRISPVPLIVEQGRAVGLAQLAPID